MGQTRNEWIRKLPRSMAEALATKYEADDVLTANEVLDCVVSYFGGVATGEEVRWMVRRIYGFEF